MTITLASIVLTILFAEAKVVRLDKSNFDEYINKGHIFIKYFSPTCPHCRNVAPTYETLSNNFEKYADKVTIAEVDCGDSHDICDKAKIRGYPTFYYYPKNFDEHIEYDGDRGIDSFSEFLSDKIGVFYRKQPTLLKEATPETWDELVMDPTKNVLVAFTAPWCGHCNRFKPQMEMAAHAFKPEENVSFVFIDADHYIEFCGQYEVQGYPTVKFFPAAGEDDSEKFKQLEKEKAEKAEARKKREDRKDELKALKDKAEATDAKQEDIDAWTKELDAEYQKLREDLVIEDTRIEPARKGANLVEKYTGDRTAAGLVAYFNRRVGTLRRLDGRVDPYAGLEQDLAEDIVRYTHAVTGTPLPKQAAETAPAEEEKKEEKKEEEKKDEEKKDEQKKEEEKKEEAPAATEKKEEERVPPPPVQEARQAVLDKLASVPSKLVRDTFKRYMDTLEKKGLKYIEDECARLSRILEAGHLSDAKEMDITVRKNVLSLFMTI